MTARTGPGALPIVLLKFGGSFITYKASDRGIRKARLRQIATAVAGVSQAVRSRIVIILGGGSIGHRAAVENGLASGEPAIEQVHRMSRALFLLKCDLASALDDCGIAAFPMQEAAIVAVDGAGLACHGRPIRQAISAGMIPILSGGPVFCAAGTMHALNSDRMGHALLASGQFKLKRFIFFSDVPGVLDSDRKVIPVITAANRAEATDLGFAAGVVDISGGMMEKVAIALDLAQRGVGSVICGGRGLDAARFEHLVCGTLAEGTQIPAAG